MRNLLICLFILFSWLTYSQNFRGLNWGASISELKSKNPNTKWELEKDDNIVFYMTEDYVVGLITDVIYAFKEGKLVGGFYNFKENHVSDNLYYQDFKTISSSLNKKYEMETEMEWNNDTWKDNSDYIGFALVMGHVSISEQYEDDKTLIRHDISSDDYGGIEHLLIYKDMKLVKEDRDSVLDDF